MQTTSSSKAYPTVFDRTVESCERRDRCVLAVSEKREGQTLSTIAHRGNLAENDNDSRLQRLSVVSALPGTDLTKIIVCLKLTLDI